MQKDATCSKKEQVQNEGSRAVKKIDYYNLDAIIAVSYGQVSRHKKENVYFGINKMQHFLREYKVYPMLDYLIENYFLKRLWLRVTSEGEIFL